MSRVGVLWEFCGSHVGVCGSLCPLLLAAVQTTSVAMQRHCRVTVL